MVSFSASATAQSIAATRAKGENCGSPGAVAPGRDRAGGTPIDFVDGAKDRRFVGRGVKPSAGRLDGGLPDLIGKHAAEALVEAHANQIDRNFRTRRLGQNVGDGPAAHNRLGILTVAEDDHQVARGLVEEIERAEQRDALLDGNTNRRALTGKSHEFGPVADERQAQQDVVVVAGERRHRRTPRRRTPRARSDPGTCRSCAGG